ncbi:hypothetical protein PARPLA_01851 [Rhodobacteraceae bacterium THAF1]|uniref:hypothetical protein n=1 Tax=Palleronia sp. THAF1 TaxID=2587842 RepID=UPI000F3D8F5B|nr:hypothetical protein [Palleronia sp. THAF1]QFU09014.1 hypothetical protein FIU81_10045 [Palleronia sp. THAF1]VDC24239.1 hypothetical protein PARPLA_01851 [Rhodobacteraceae bacterium THAF1]
MHILIPLLALAFALSPLVTNSFGGFDANAFPVPQEAPPVQPAGYAFAIWGVIYLALIAHGLIGLRHKDDPAWRATRVPLAISLAVGAVWIPVANASPVWASVLILVMLAGARVAHARAGDGWALRVPLGLYAGWLTAASAVSVGLLLAGYGVLGAVPAAFVALALAGGLALATLRRASLGYAFAVVWALVGVVVQNWGGAWSVAIAAAVLGVVLTALALRPSSGAS